ncbi:MAG TPA: EAL domain-containing protein [Acidimicrobiales bacterium]
MLCRDFGTGYSSLSYLRSFPIDFLKIDRSFVNELGGESNDQGRALVSSIISIGHNLKLAVIAEGIEKFRPARRAPRRTLRFRPRLCHPAPPDEIREILVRHGKSFEVEPVQTVP